MKQNKVVAILLAVLVFSSLILVGCESTNNDESADKTEPEAIATTTEREQVKDTEPKATELEKEPEETTEVTEEPEENEEVTFEVISDGSFTVTKDGIQKDFTDEDNLKIEWYSDALCPDCCHAHQETEDFFSEKIAEGIIEIKYFPVAILSEHSEDNYCLNAAVWVLGVAEFDPEHAMEFMSAVFDEDFHPGFEDEVEKRPTEAFVELAKKSDVAEDAITKILDHLDPIKEFVNIHSENYRDNEHLKALSPDVEKRVFVPFIVVNDQVALSGEDEDTDKFILEPIQKMIDNNGICDLDCHLPLDVAFTKEEAQILSVIEKATKEELHEAWGDPTELDEEANSETWIKDTKGIVVLYDEDNKVTEVIVEEVDQSKTDDSDSEEKEASENTDGNLNQAPKFPFTFEEALELTNQRNMQVMMDRVAADGFIYTRDSVYQAWGKPGFVEPYVYEQYEGEFTIEYWDDPSQDEEWAVWVAVIFIDADDKIAQFLGKGKE